MIQETNQNRTLDHSRAFVQQSFISIRKGTEKASGINIRRGTENVPLASVSKGIIYFLQETQLLSLVWEDPLKKEMATHSSTLAWKIQAVMLFHLHIICGSLPCSCRIDSYDTNHMATKLEIFTIRPLKENACHPRFKSLSHFYILLLEHSYKVSTAVARVITFGHLTFLYCFSNRN